jgi:nucleoside 2-deoxyribosyltransferase
MGREPGSAKVYVASPLGFAVSSDSYRAVVAQALAKEGLDALDPWHDPRRAYLKALRAAEAAGDPVERRRLLAEGDMAAGARNRSLIEEASGVFAILDGADVDSGTASEVGFAAGRGLPVVGLRTDQRRSGENDGVAVNLQVEYFVRMNGGAVFASLPKAVAALRKLVRATPRP